MAKKTLDKHGKRDDEEEPTNSLPTEYSLASEDQSDHGDQDAKEAELRGAAKGK